MLIKKPSAIYPGLLFLLSIAITGVICDNDGNYIVGVGIADITGPVAEINMMGYANFGQSARGLHIRLFARAFIFQDSFDSPPAVFLSADLQSVDQAVKLKVVERLQEKYGPDLFSQKNVLLSGIHTHSGPAGFMQNLLYSITSLGFNEKSFDAIVTGMVESISNAWDSRQPSKIFLNKGQVTGANRNRSPTAYLLNPQWERDLYKQPDSDGNLQDVDVDKTMTLLRIEAANGTQLGAINWFAVHPTSMNNTNKLISGDNKGYASQLFEKEMNPPGTIIGKGNFVSAFASTNLGDVSPNTAGACCIDTWESCENPQSSCPSDTIFTKHCIAFGEGTNGNMEESAKINGQRQFQKAWELFKDEDADNKAKPLRGPVDFRHQYVNMSDYLLRRKDFVESTPKCLNRRTCAAGLGFAFAAGTTDGPGMFDFVQGDNKTDHPFWDQVKKFIRDPSQEMIDCQYPKPILLAVGEVHFPYDWVASIAETQILRIGNLYILGIPGELTTMAGRRVIRNLKRVIAQQNPGPEGVEPQIIVAGLSNVYTHYITTFEEYQVQRYEGASTMFGPCTLDAYMLQYAALAENLLNNREELDEGPMPEDLLDKQMSLIPPILIDTAPIAKNFGDVLLEPVPEYNLGDTVVARFVGGHPRHRTMRGGTFFTVERDIGDGNEVNWQTVTTDADWNTKFRWSRPSLLSTQSVIETSWDIPEDAEPGYYRIVHFGYYKPELLNPGLRAYQGTTAVFKVVGKGNEAGVGLNHPEFNPKKNKASKITTAGEFWRALGSAIKNKKDEQNY